MEEIDARGSEREGNHAQRQEERSPTPADHGYGVSKFAAFRKRALEFQRLIPPISTRPYA
jgi:hypothetical protein